MAGYYIRPMCTTEASFVSSYNPSKIEKSNSESNIFENPKTGRNHFILLLVVIITIGSVSILYKKEKN